MKLEQEIPHINGNKCRCSDALKSVGFWQAKALWPQTRKTSLEGAAGDTSRQKKAPERWAGFFLVCLKASYDVAETACGVPNTDTFTLEMGHWGRRLVKVTDNRNLIFSRNKPKAFPLLKVHFNALLGLLKTALSPSLQGWCCSMGSTLQILPP